MNANEKPTRYAKRLATGLCVQCDRPVAEKPNGGTYPICVQHRDEKRATRERRKADGLCRECRTPVERIGLSLCARHLEARKRRREGLPPIIPGRKELTKKITSAQQARSNGATVQELMAKHQVTDMTIYRWLTTDIQSRNAPRQAPEAPKPGKMTLERAKIVTAEKRRGRSLKSLADRYGVSSTMILYWLETDRIRRAKLRGSRHIVEISHR